MLQRGIRPHLGDDDANVLVPDLDGRRDELGVHNMLAEEDEGVSGPGDMVGVQLIRNQLRAKVKYNRDEDAPF